MPDASLVKVAPYVRGIIDALSEGITRKAVDVVVGTNQRETKIIRVDVNGGSPGITQRVYQSSPSPLLS